MAKAIAEVPELAAELGKHIEALDVNPRSADRTAPSPSARWQFRTERPLLSADRARRKQRMNAPGLVRHLVILRSSTGLANASAVALPTL